MANTTRKTTVTVQGINQEAVRAGAADAGMRILLTLAGIVGTWSLACVVGGIINAGGVAPLAKAWLSAVTGM